MPGRLMRAGVGAAVLTPHPSQARRLSGSRPALERAYTAVHALAAHPPTCLGWRLAPMPGTLAGVHSYITHPPTRPPAYPPTRTLTHPPTHTCFGSS